MSFLGSSMRWDMVFNYGGACSLGRGEVESHFACADCIGYRVTPSGTLTPKRPLYTCQRPSEE